MNPERAEDDTPPPDYAASALDLLDEFDRYASTPPGDSSYIGSPFQERVRSVLTDAGLYDAKTRHLPA